MEEFLYHNVLYVYVLNTPWFVWAVTGFVIAFNALAPLVYWFTFSGRRMRFMKKSSKD